MGRPYVGTHGAFGGTVGARHCLAPTRGAHRPGALPRDLFVPAMNERVGMNDRGRPSGSPLRWDTWSFWRDRGGEALPRPHPAAPRAAHRPGALPRELFVPAVNELVGMNDRGRPSGSPLRWDTWSFWRDRGGEACLAPTRAAHRPGALPRELFVPAVNELVGMNDRGRPSGSPLRWDTWSFWRDRGGEACLAATRDAHRPGALPRELFVPAVNELVGMNDRGRPSGSPLRWDTWSFWPDRVGARHCLALTPRRRIRARRCLANCLSRP